MASLLCCSFTVLHIRVSLCVYVDELSRRGCIVIINHTKISKSTDTGTVDIRSYQYYSLKSFCTGDIWYCILGPITMLTQLAAKAQSIYLYNEFKEPFSIRGTRQPKWWGRTRGIKTSQACWRLQILTRKALYIRQSFSVAHFCFVSGWRLWFSCFDFQPTTNFLA